MASILVIDDHDDPRGAMRRILELVGHEVHEASDGAEGLRLYREQPADVVVCDLVMPVKGGGEVIVELRETYPEVKILAVTGGAPYRLLDARLLGADAGLAKPFDVEELQEAVAQLLEREVGE